MKQKNNLVRFKNSFLPVEKQETLGPILEQSIPGTIHPKLKILIKIYKDSLLEDNYNPMTAFRVIILCLSNNYQQQIDIQKQIQRLSLKCRGLRDRQKIQGARIMMDLLMNEKVKKRLSKETFNLYKIIAIKSLKDYYVEIQNKKEAKKAAILLIQFSKNELQKQKVKRLPDTYSQILDIYLSQSKKLISNLNHKKKRIQSSERLNQVVGVLEKCQNMFSGKYQQQLVWAYWGLARVHYQLHYLAYTRKYADIAANIAERIGDQQSLHQIKDLQDMIDF